MNAITHDALMKSAVAGRNTGRAENIARKILLDAGADPSSLEKVINTGTGLVAYDLQAPAKNLYPITTPVRNLLPRVAGGVGVATNWKAINGLVGSGWDASGWVPEGQRAGQMNYATAAKVAIPTCWQLRSRLRLMSRMPPYPDHSSTRWRIGRRRLTQFCRPTLKTA